MGLKTHTLFADPSQIPKAENLKPAAVGQDRAIPVHEGMEPPQAPDQFVPRPQKEVVGVGQDDLGSDFTKSLGKDRLDGPLGPDGHENRRFDHPMGSAESSSPGAGIAIFM
jgi:hypothetical protein